MTAPNLSSFPVFETLLYLQRDSKGKLDGMVSHCLSTEALRMENESMRKQRLATSYDERAQVRGCGVVQDLVEDAQILTEGANKLKKYLFFRTKLEDYVH